MSKFEVGQEVILHKIENVYGEDHSLGHDLPKRVRISHIDDDMYDYTVEDLEGHHIASVYEKYLEEVAQVTEQRIVRVGTKQGLAVQHTTNTKKKNVSIQRTGTAIGKIKVNKIDELIELLVTLKSEV